MSDGDRIGAPQRRTPSPWRCGPGDLGVEDARDVGLQVSDCISDGVQVHPLAPIYAPYPKWTHKKRLE